MDLSGHVVKRLPVAYWPIYVCSPLDLICVESAGEGCSVINPATGAVSSDTPPDDNSLSDKEVDWGESAWPEGPEYHVFALGRVESTGEYKVLRISNIEVWAGFESSDECSSRGYSVLTVNGSRRNRWRHAEPHEGPVDMDNPVVVGRSVYYFSKDEYHWIEEDPDFISAFDLETEQWTYIKGRPMDDDGSSDKDMDLLCSAADTSPWRGLALRIQLKGRASLMESNPARCRQRGGGGGVLPLDVLFDVLVRLPAKEICRFRAGVLLLYDPKANVFSEVDTRRLDAVG
ncbi:hypothetical protein EJB05_49280, partial [Eragrostis curvula]